MRRGIRSATCVSLSFFLSLFLQTDPPLPFPAPFSSSSCLRAQACVVRVMKNRKQLIHQELITEVIKQLAHRFQPSPQMIKRSIERLIEKEYLERDEDDRKKLKYMVRSSFSPSLPPFIDGSSEISC